MSDSVERRLLYFADPMCSWCWGFSPVIHEVRRSLKEKGVAVGLVMGGLRPGTTRPLTEDDKGTIREHWQHVHQATGQPFEFGFFDRPDFVYDTEPASRAVVTAGRLAADGLALLEAIHTAFYRDNRDVTDAMVLSAIATDCGMDGHEFRRSFTDHQTIEDTQGGFALARELGVRSFPTVLAVDGQKPTLITVGYRPRDHIFSTIESWLSQSPLPTVGHSE